MEQLKSIKLKEHGVRGMDICFEEESKDKDGNIIYIDVKKTYSVPVPDYIKNDLNNLKEYFLDILGYFTDEERKAIAKADDISNVEIDRVQLLMNYTTISGVIIGEDSFRIIGSRILLNNKVIKLTHPEVTCENYYDYEDVLTILISIKRNIKNYIENIELQNPKQYLLDLSTSKDDKQRIEDQEHDECKEEMLIRLEARGVLKKGINDKGMKVVSKEPTSRSSIPKVKKSVNKKEKKLSKQVV